MNNVSLYLLVLLHCTACCQVTFPLELDVYDYCTPELQQQLSGPRTALKDYQDKLALEKRTAKQLKTEDGPKPAPAVASSSGAAAEAAVGDVEMKDADATASAAGPSSSVVAGAQTGASQPLKGEWWCVC